MKDGKRGAYLIRPKGGWGNIGLLKDIGIIPYMLYKNHNFNSVLVGYNDPIPSMPYLQTYVKGLKIEYLPDDTLETRFKYIESRAQKIDLLILYGAGEDNIPIVNFYKEVRPDGKIYLATDANLGWMDSIHFQFPEWKNFLKLIDVVGASGRETQRFLNSKWPVTVECIRNGWYNFPKVSFDNLFEQKENIILTVGRIGTDQKNNQMLLEAFAQCCDEIPDWKVRLVGGIDKKFNDYIEKYFEKNPHLKNRVIFVGQIDDKAKLNEEFRKAKIFTLTSTFEGGTPNVTSEALFAGCYMIVTDFGCEEDATAEGRCGEIVPLNDIPSLADTFKKVCNDSNKLLGGGVFAYHYAREYFDAEKIVARLYYLLYGSN